MGLVPCNVTEAVDPPRSERKERPTFNLDQARLFLESARDDRWEALYVLVIQTGMRRGELFGLGWDDVDLDNDWLHVRQALAPGGKSFNAPKTAKGRRKIRLTPVAVEALKRHKVAQNQERLLQGDSWRDHGLGSFPVSSGHADEPGQLYQEIVQAPAEAGRTAPDEFPRSAAYLR